MSSLANDMVAAQKRHDSQKASDNDAFFDTIWTDEMYEDALNQYSSEPWFQQYRSMLMANPWLRSKQARFTTDPLTGMFNYKGAATAYYSGMRENAMNWLSEHADQFRQEYYDSASQQVARERSAGLNPDLNGQVTPGSAAENDSSSLPALQNGTSETGAAIASAGMEFIGSVLSFGSQIQSLNIGSAQRISAEIGASSGARDLVLNEIANIVGTNPSKDSVSAVLAQKPRLFRGYSRRTRKFLEHYLNRYQEGDLGVDALVAELRNRAVSANRDTAEIMSSPYYSSDLNKWISNVGENLTKFVALADKYSAMTSATLHGVENEFWNGKNGESNQNAYGRYLAADLNAKTDSAESVSASARYQKEMENTWNQLMKSVKGDGKHWYNTIGMILIMALRSQVMQPLHFGVGNSVSVSDKGISRSRSFHM